MGIIFRLSRPVVWDDDVHGHKQTVTALLRFLNRTSWGRGEGANQHLVLVRTIRESYRITEVMMQPLSKVAVKKYAAGDVFHVLVGCVYVLVGFISEFAGSFSVLVSFLSCVSRWLFSVGRLSFMCFSVVFLRDCLFPFAR